MNKQQLQSEIDAIRESGLQQRASDLHNWLFADKKEVLHELLELIALQSDLITILIQEIEPPSNFDVRHQQSEFYPFSKTPTRKR